MQCNFLTLKECLKSGWIHCKSCMLNVKDMETFNASVLLFSSRHYPKTSFTIVTDTPENLRLKQQTMLNSQVRPLQISPITLLCPVIPAQSLFSLTARDTRPNLIASPRLCVSYPLCLSPSLSSLSASQRETRTHFSALHSGQLDSFD